MTFVVFDLDDTLYLERDFVRSGYDAVDRWARDTRDLTGLGAACRRIFASGERRRVFDRALIALGLRPDPDLVAQLVDVYRNHVPDIALQPDAHRALLRHAGRAALVSDGPAPTQAAKVAALGLEPFLAPVVLTGALGPNADKPAPIAFRKVERLTGLYGASLVYVADNPAKDFLAPRKLGWQTVMIARPERVHHTVPPTPGHAPAHRIQTLDALDECLAPVGVC